MNIAITTWYSESNAGTFFQLFGLYKYLKNRGHHVEFINYSPVDKDFISRGWYYYLSQPLSLLKRKIAQKKIHKRYNQGGSSIQSPIADTLRAFSGNV